MVQGFVLSFLVIEGNQRAHLLCVLQMSLISVPQQRSSDKKMFYKHFKLEFASWKIAHEELEIH